MKLYSETHPDLAAHDTLFIHGNLGSRRWWHPTLDAWRAEGSLGDGRLVLADARGCGRSPELDGALTLDQMAEDFAGLIRNELRGPVDLVGHSLGGLVAARVMTMVPVRRAILLDPVGPRGVTFDDAMYGAFDQMAKDPALTRAVILGTVHGGVAHLSEEYQSALAHDAQRAVAGAGRAALEILRRTDVAPSLAAVRTPTLVVHGAEDQVITPADGEALARALGEGRFESVAGRGHCWNVEDAAGFTRRLRQWLTAD